MAFLAGPRTALADELSDAISLYHLAQKEFVKGNPQPLKDICSHADDVTVLGGYGGFEKGWSAQVEKRYDWAAARFNSTEDERRVENISLVVTSEMAYSVDIERTKIRLANTDEVRPMALRVTSIFRRESGQWKVVHRHADPLVEVKPAAAILKR
jgi:ketosteroid isomerase-like protein